MVLKGKIPRKQRRLTRRTCPTKAIRSILSAGYDHFCAVKGRKLHCKKEHLAIQAQDGGGSSVYTRSNLYLQESSEGKKAIVSIRGVNLYSIHLVLHVDFSCSFNIETRVNRSRLSALLFSTFWQFSPSTALPFIIALSNQNHSQLKRIHLFPLFNQSVLPIPNPISLFHYCCAINPLLNSRETCVSCHWLNYPDLSSPLRIPTF